MVWAPFLADYLLASVCCTAVWASRIASVTQVLEVSVTGGHAYREGCLGVFEFAYCLWGPYFYVSIADFTKLLWSGDGIKIVLIFPLCTSVFPGSLFRPCKRS